METFYLLKAIKIVDKLQCLPRATDETVTVKADLKNSHETKMREAKNKRQTDGQLQRHRIYSVEYEDDVMRMIWK
jgi:hypothetical protein